MLGGGTFTSQNKKIPGSYINFISAAKAEGVLSERGIVAYAVSLDWGNDTGVFEISKEEFQRDSLSLLGYEYTAEAVKSFRELFRHATRALLYRLNAGVKASNDFATAKYSGTRGNNLKVVISTNPDESAKWDVSLYLGTTLVDEQRAVASATELVDNDYVIYKKEAVLAQTAGTVLTSGTNGEVTGEKHQRFLSEIEGHRFHVLACDTMDVPTKEYYVAFTKRMREELGIKFQTVLFGKAADYEGVINVKNSSSLIPWVTGAEAGCEVNKSITNMTYDGELQLSDVYSQTKLEDAIEAGEFVFHKVGQEYRVLVDINSKTTVTPEKGEDFKKNQTIRVLDQIGNDIASMFNNKYNGKIANDISGRVSFWSDLVTYFKQLVIIRAIEDFNSQDIEVLPGTNKTDVIANSVVTPVSSMEKLYMTVIVQ